jgi:hypothetical protein
MYGQTNANDQTRLQLLGMVRCESPLTLPQCPTCAIQCRLLSRGTYEAPGIYRSCSWGDGLGSHNARTAGRERSPNRTSAPFSPADTLHWNKALRGLRDAGWIDGRNLIIEYRYAEGKKERLLELVINLIREKVDVIVTTVTVDTLTAKNATAEIPIVMVCGDRDCQKLGAAWRKHHRIVANDTRPEWKTPGVAKANCPLLTSVAVLFDPEDPLSMLNWNEARLSAQTLGRAGLGPRHIAIRNRSIKTPHGVRNAEPNGKNRFSGRSPQGNRPKG